MDGGMGEGIVRMGKFMSAQLQNDPKRHPRCLKKIGIRMTGGAVGRIKKT